jgi:hypothetical protein
VQAERFAYDRYLVDQLVRPIVNLYRVAPLAAGEAPAGGPIAFVRQKRMAIKEDIRFFADEQETEELFRIKARSVFDIGGARSDVTEPDGAPIGVRSRVAWWTSFRTESGCRSRTSSTCSWTVA